MSEQIMSKDDVSPELVEVVAKSHGLIIAPDRIDVIALRLRELFDLAAPLESATVEGFEPTQPFDARWTEEVTE
jgi:hypothetical protein